MDGLYGYARVSTEKQDLERQLVQLRKCGVKEEDIYTDKFTGTSTDREQYKKLCEIVKAGDTVVIESLSRLGRSAKELLEIIEKWNEQGIILESLKEKLSLDTPTGKLLVQILASMAEFEVSLLRERVREGLAVARAKGHFGGRPKMPPDKIEKALKLKRAGTHSISEICKVCGLSSATLYRAIKAQGGECNV